MTSRERILTAIRGGMPDHIPWAPRWDLWFNAVTRDGRLPEKYRNWDMFDVARDLGFAIKGNYAPLYKEEMDGVEVITTERRTPEGLEETTIYRTPVGDLSRVYFTPPELEEKGISGRIMQPLIKDVKDYDIVLYIIAHTRITPTYDELEAYIRKVGDDGLAFPQLGYLPMNQFLIQYCDYERAYYELADNPDRVEALLEALEEQMWQIVEIAGDAPIEVAEISGNYDAEMTPPPLYRKYFLPYFQKISRYLHDKGKLVMTHIDGDNTGLLELLEASGMDVGEAWTPYPMTPVTTAQARRVWGTRVALWGGLPATVLSMQCPDDEFDRFFGQQLLELAPGSAFVLGTGDNVPTDCSWERLDRVTQLVEEYGSLPIDVEKARGLAGG